MPAVLQNPTHRDSNVVVAEKEIVLQKQIGCDEPGYLETKHLDQASMWKRLQLDGRPELSLRAALYLGVAAHLDLHRLRTSTEELTFTDTLSDDERSRMEDECGAAWTSPTSWSSMDLNSVCALVDHLSSGSVIKRNEPLRILHNQLNWLMPGIRKRLLCPGLSFLFCSLGLARATFLGSADELVSCESGCHSNPSPLTWSSPVVIHPAWSCLVLSCVVSSFRYDNQIPHGKI